MSAELEVPEDLLVWWRSALAEQASTEEGERAEPAGYEAARALATSTRTMGEAWRALSMLPELPEWVRVAVA